MTFNSIRNTAFAAFAISVLASSAAFAGGYGGYGGGYNNGYNNNYGHQKHYTYKKRCHWESQKVWSDYHYRWIWKKVKVCY